jgi:hypothetical protein
MSEMSENKKLKEPVWKKESCGKLVFKAEEFTKDLYDPKEGQLLAGMYNELFSDRMSETFTGCAMNVRSSYLKGVNKITLLFDCNGSCPKEYKISGNRHVIKESKGIVLLIKLCLYLTTKLGYVHIIHTYTEVVYNLLRNLKIYTQVFFLQRGVKSSKITLRII